MGKHSSLPLCPTTALSEIQSDPDIWHRVQVLLHDLGKVGSDVLSEKRLSSTTNELYISGPYFTEAEATRILSTPVEASNHGEDSIATPPNNPTATIQDAIHQRLANFFEKRKASGDARPCGPHDMLPIYLDVFKVQKGDLKAEKFLGRLKRSGLGDFTSKPPGASAGAIESGKKGRRSKQGKKGH